MGDFGFSKWFQDKSIWVKVRFWFKASGYEEQNNPVAHRGSNRNYKNWKNELPDESGNSKNSKRGE